MDLKRQTGSSQPTLNAGVHSLVFSTDVFVQRPCQVMLVSITGSETCPADAPFPGGDRLDTASYEVPWKPAEQDGGAGSGSGVKCRLLAKSGFEQVRRRCWRALWVAGEGSRQVKVLGQSGLVLKNQPRGGCLGGPSVKHPDS